MSKDKGRTAIVRKNSAVAKATVYESETLPSRLEPTNEDSNVFRQYGGIPPRYEPTQLNELFDRSSSLRPNVDTYKTNIEGFGHRFEPVINLDAADANDQIRQSLLMESLYDGANAIEISDDDVTTRRLEMKAAMEIEKLKLDLFFQNCTDELSFTQLREQTRHDLEVTGNAYWEIVRNKLGQIAEINYAQSHTIRLLHLDPTQFVGPARRRISLTSYRDVQKRRRFRRYVQVINGLFFGYFKQLGDPRLVSAKTGNSYTSEADMQKAENGVFPATELIHFRIHDPTSVYGVPRWIGATCSVLGSRAAEEVNLLYFDNKAIPPLVVLVSGGKLATGAAERIKNYIKDNIKGRDNFHSILVLEAEGKPAVAGGAPPRVQIELKPMADAMQKDALFLNYDERNTDKIGATFRVPKLLRGDTKDFNRATADAAIRYAEMQVFQPERQAMDHVINKRILEDMGIRYWRFATNSPIEKDPSEISSILDKVKNYLTPEEARPIVARVLGIDLKELDSDWTKVPAPIYLAMIAAGILGGPAPTVPGKPGAQPAEAGGDILGKLAALRDSMREQAAAQSKGEETAIRRVLKVPAKEFNTWIAPTGT